MSQISPPIRILLAAVLALSAAWFIFLRPGTEAVTPPAPPAASGLGNAVDSANQAAATANAAAAQSADPAAASSTTVTTTTGGAQAPATSKPAPKADAELGLPASVAKAVAKKKTLVMLFWNKKAFDDQAVRRELRGIDRHKGKVQVHVASIKDVARYAPITRGVNLEQSPTVVVVKGDTADALVGYVDAGTINQTISDVTRSSRGQSGAEPANPYLNAVYDECQSGEDHMLGIVENINDRASFHAALDNVLKLSRAYNTRVRKLNAPKKYRTFKRDFDAYNARSSALFETLLPQLKASTDPAQLKALLAKFDGQINAMEKPLVRKYGKLGLSPCFDA